MNMGLKNKKLKAEYLIFPALLLFLRTFLTVDFISAFDQFSAPTAIFNIILTAAAAFAYSVALNYTCPLSTTFGIFLFAMLAADPLLFVRVENGWTIAEIGVVGVLVCVMFSTVKAKTALAALLSLLLVFVSPRALFSFFPMIVLLGFAECFNSSGKLINRLTLPVSAFAGGIVAVIANEIILHTDSILAPLGKMCYITFPLNRVFENGLNPLNLFKGFAVSLPVIILSVLFVADVITKKGGKAFAVPVIAAYVISIFAFFVKSDFADLAAMNAAPLFIMLYGVKKGVEPVVNFAGKAENFIRKRPAIAFISVIWLAACAFSFRPYVKYFEYTTRYRY